MPNDELPDWDRVLSAAAHLQKVLPDAVLVGGTALAAYAKHRVSQDAAHVIADLRQVNGESAILQLQIQLANPLPFDLDTMKLSEYKLLDVRWHEWATVQRACQRIAEVVFDSIVGAGR